MATYAKTQSELAEKIGTSRVTISEAARSTDFPKSTKKGYNVDRVQAWFKKHSRGPFRKRGGGKATDVDGVTLTEANIRRTLEQAENERIKKERQLVEQALELGQLVTIDDVKHIYSQTVATVSAVHDSLAEAVDRAMPEKAPSAKAWEEVRKRVMGLCEKLGTDASAAMMELE